MAEDRSHGIAARVHVEDTLAWIDALPVALDGEDTLLTEVAGRILARDANSNLDLPPVDRAAVDGVAVHAEETIGASTYNPCVLQWTAPPGDLGPGVASRVNAGDPLPGGADAVIRLGHVGLDGLGRAVLSEPTVAGSGVERRGSQAARGSRLIAAGHRLTAAAIGMLASAGLARVCVVAKPRVRCLLAAGTIQAGNPLPRGEVYDANLPLLRALIERDGGIVVEQHTHARDRAALRHALLLPGADLILVVGGTGSGSNDHAAPALAEAGEVAIHGVALRYAETARHGPSGGSSSLPSAGPPRGVPVGLRAHCGTRRPQIWRSQSSPSLPIQGNDCNAQDCIGNRHAGPTASPLPGRDLAEPIAFFAEAGLKAIAEGDGSVLVPEKSESIPKARS